MSGFINPYNFFPLGERCAEERTAEEKVSGVITYSILSKSPLFVPNTEVVFQQDEAEDEETSRNLPVQAVSYQDISKNEKKHIHMVFNSLELTSEMDVSKMKLEEYQAPKAPFIPGSEVRGMIRSEYEMLTDSCLSILNDDNILSKRVHAPFQAGLIMRDGSRRFFICEADDCLFRAESTGSSKDAPSGDYGVRNNKMQYIGYEREGGVYSYLIKEYTTGELVYVNRRFRQGGKNIAKELKKEKNGNSTTPGYIMKGFPGPDMQDNKKAEKHNLHIFCKKNSSPILIDIESLLTVVRLYLENSEENVKIRPFVEEYQLQLNKFISGEIKQQFFPVYFSIVKDASGNVIDLFLSPSSITRELYSRKLGDIIDETHKPCSDSKKLCPACALFGRMDANESTASHLRFSDLRFTGSSKRDKPDYLGKTTLIPLSAPKISNLAFYLQKPDDAIFWTYDYYVTIDGKIKPYDKTINGRKFYWHHNNGNNVLTVKEWKNQNKTVYPLSAGNTFAGELYFDNISKTDLNRLIYIINCGENDKELAKKSRGHKLGAGRPAGLGSIAAKVTSVTIRTVSVDSYICKDYPVNPDKDHPGYTKPDLPQEDNYIKMTSFNNNFSAPVKYPCVKGKEEVYEWFSANHKGVNRNNQTITAMPQKRNSELFVEHLKAMEGEMLKTPIVSHEESLQREGDEMIAVLNGKANKSGYFVFFDISGKKEGSCNINQLPPNLKHLPISDLKGKKIKVKYLRDEEKNGRIYPQYKVLGEA